MCVFSILQFLKRLLLINVCFSKLLRAKYARRKRRALSYSFFDDFKLSLLSLLKYSGVTPK